MALILAAAIMPGAAAQAVTRDLDDSDGDVAQRAAAERRLEAVQRHRTAQGLTLGRRPIGDEAGGGIERHIIVKQPDPQRRQRAEAAPWPAVGAAHLEVALEADFRKGRR